MTHILEFFVYTHHYHHSNYFVDLVVNTVVRGLIYGVIFKAFQHQSIVTVFLVSLVVLAVLCLVFVRKAR